MEFDVTMDLVRETKSMVRYVPRDGQPAVGSLYIHKDKLGGTPYPETIVITVKVV
jgi:hypothetical protein